MADLKFGTRKQVVLDYGIWEGDLVLDVGCGPGNPEIGMASEFPRADVLVDLNPELISLYGKGRAKFLLADIRDLPFRDDTFDFVWCSHILEHVDDPKRACKELVRVGTRGRIKTPSPFKEMFSPLPYHFWLVTWYSDTLVFERKYKFLESEEWKTVIRSSAVMSWRAKMAEWREKKDVKVLPARVRETIFDWVDSFMVEIHQ